MGFGDLLPDGKVSDKIVSNNGDVIKVMSTVIQILKDFTSLHPEIKVYFTGSSPERIVLYRRILKTYHNVYNKEFIISALIKNKNEYEEVLFDTGSREVYYAFL